MVRYVCYAVAEAPSWWPPKLSEATLDYSLDISSAVDPTSDHITQVAASVAPSGAGELALSNLQIDDDYVITLTTSSGQPTRIYTIKLNVTMGDGRLFEFSIYQAVPPGLRGYSIPPPPTPGFSTPIVVGSPIPSLDFSKPSNSGLRTLGWL